MRIIKFIALITCLLGIIHCCSINDDNNLNAETNSDPLEFADREFKECFKSISLESDEEILMETFDTIYFSISNDTLILDIILNYNCCGMLNDSIIIDNENVNIYIYDNCIDNCLCYCLCGNEFRYSFINYLEKDVHFYIYFKEYNNDDYTLYYDLIYSD